MDEHEQSRKSPLSIPGYAVDSAPGIDPTRFQCFGPAKHTIVSERNPGVCPSCDSYVGFAPLSSLVGGRHVK